MDINVYLIGELNQDINELLVNSEILCNNLNKINLLTKPVEFIIYDKPLKEKYKNGFIKTDYYGLNSFFNNEHNIFLSNKPFNCNGYIAFTRHNSSFISLYAKCNHDLFSNLITDNELLNFIKKLNTNDYVAIICHEVGHLQGLKDNENSFMSIRCSNCFSAHESPINILKRATQIN